MRPQDHTRDAAQDGEAAYEAMRAPRYAVIGRNIVGCDEVTLDTAHTRDEAFAALVEACRRDPYAWDILAVEHEGEEIPVVETPIRALRVALRVALPRGLGRLAPVRSRHLAPYHGHPRPIERRPIVDTHHDPLEQARAARSDAYATLGAVLASGQPSVEAKRDLERRIHEYHQAARRAGR